MTDSATITKVAQLAKIGLEEEEVILFQKDITRMLEFVSILNQVPTQGVPPLVNPAFSVPAFRDDVIITDGTTEQILSNAPQKDQNMFLVPKIVETP